MFNLHVNQRLPSLSRLCGNVHLTYLLLVLLLLCCLSLSQLTSPPSLLGFAFPKWQSRSTPPSSACMTGSRIPL